MPDTLTLANCSSSYGDRAGALGEVIERGPVDVVTGGYLARPPVMVPARTRANDPTTGYATSFLRHLEPLLATVWERGTERVVNAGGLAAHGAGARVVVPGRVTPTSLVVGPVAWHVGWACADGDRLAGAVVVGRLLECGTRATGGNDSLWARTEDATDRLDTWLTEAAFRALLPDLPVRLLP